MVTQLTSLLLTLVPLAAVGAALFGLVYLALRSSVTTVALVLALWIVTVAMRDSIDLSMTFATVRVSALDVIAVVLAAVGLARALSEGVRSVGVGLAVALLLLLVVHVARGAIEFDAQLSINTSRGWLYLIAGLMYAATVPGGWNQSIWKVLIAAGIALAGIAVPYMLTEGVEPAGTFVFRNGEWVASRSIVATGALLILQAAILAPVIGWPSKGAALLVMFGAGGIVVLLQHRSVWLAGLLVAIIGFVWWSKRQPRDRPGTVFAATGVALILLPIAVWGFLQAGALVDSAEETVSRESTATWRTTGWEQLIAANDSPSALAVGTPAGVDLTRTVGLGTKTDASPHNVFVDAFIRFGVPGVVLICWLGLLLWFRRAEVANATGITALAVGLLLVTQLVFGMAYTQDIAQGIVLGILVSGLSATASVRTPAAARAEVPMGRLAAG